MQTLKHPPTCLNYMLFFQVKEQSMITHRSRAYLLYTISSGPSTTILAENTLDVGTATNNMWISFIGVDS